MKLPPGLAAKCLELAGETPAAAGDAGPVELPVPPSVNALWRVVRSSRLNSKARVTLSKRYRSWLDAAVLLLRAGMPPAARYPVAVRVTILRGAGWKRGRDADNVLKAISDSLVKAGRLADDDEDHVAEFLVRFGPDARAACVLVSVEPLPAKGGV